MGNTDRRFLKEIKDRIQTFVSQNNESCSKVQHPIDLEIVEMLNQINLASGDEFEIYQFVKEVKSLWKTLIKKSIICLRYFDNREPFQDYANKKPIAYGINELNKYFERYIEFEQLLYGGVKYYRDHVIHVFRVWMLGINILLDPKCHYLDGIMIEKGFEVNSLEKLSIWTIISLTHDLGYPLEKSIQIIDKTKVMMNSFIQNPIVTMDTSFSGVQNSMNDYVLRFISSKMNEIEKDNPHKRVCFDEEEYKKILQDTDKTKLEEYRKGKNYVARLQPKYYFKFQKSLEHNAHGVLSSLILYKLLIYFLESDFSTNEDYIFAYEDARQFYIRREILRAIASHTCHDVYQNSMLNFSFLLILCDDAQEWGRKSIAELYVSKDNDYEYHNIDIKLDVHPFLCIFSDKYCLGKYDSAKIILENFLRQSNTYVCVFRDGQDTKSRNFNFVRQTKIEVQESTANRLYYISLIVNAEEQAKIVLDCEQNSEFEKDDSLVNIFKEVFKTIVHEDEKTIIHELSL